METNAGKCKVNPVLTLSLTSLVERIVDSNSERRVLLESGINVNVSLSRAARTFSWTT